MSTYERSKGPLSETQHAELIQILEKLLAKGSQIQQDYLRAKADDNTPPHTWYSTMLRIGQVAEARAMMNLIKSYGNPDVVYSFPASAVPPDVGKKETSGASAKAPSPTPSASSRSVTATVRTPSSYVPTQHGLSVRAARTDVWFRLDGSDRSNQGQGGNSQNQYGYRNHGNQGGGRGKQKGNRNPNANQNQGCGCGGRGKYNPPQGHNPPPNTQPGQNQGKNPAHDCVAATFDDDVFNLTDDHLEVQPLVPIREEFLHILSTLASHHLNVTVIVQDKDRTCPASDLRTAGKA